AEETGIRVGEVRYEGSQPWPFPCSLMMAFRAEVAAGTGTEIEVDGVELTDARLFTRAVLAAAIGAGEVHLPMRSSIARSLIEDWFGGPLPDRSVRCSGARRLRGGGLSPAGGGPRRGTGWSRPSPPGRAPSARSGCRR